LTSIDIMRDALPCQTKNIRPIPHSRYRRRLVAALALTLAVLTSSALQAQRADAEPDSTRHGTSSAVAMTGALIVAGAAGAQVILTPKRWPRTAGGFGKRVADQTGFYLVQSGTKSLVGRALGQRDDATPCTGEALLPCAVVRTFTARDRHESRRLNVPFIASTLVATAASVSWRPERESRSESLSFAATRVGVVVAGFVAERAFVEWRRRRQDAGRS
jgi:hypothetical protein